MPPAPRPAPSTAASAPTATRATSAIGATVNTVADTRATAAPTPAAATATRRLEIPTAGYGQRYGENGNTYARGNGYGPSGTTVPAIAFPRPPDGRSNMAARVNTRREATAARASPMDTHPAATSPTVHPASTAIRCRTTACVPASAAATRSLIARPAIVPALKTAPIATADVRGRFARLRRFHQLWRFQRRARSIRRRFPPLRGRPQLRRLRQQQLQSSQGPKLQRPFLGWRRSYKAPKAPHFSGGGATPAVPDIPAADLQRDTAASTTKPARSSHQHSLA